MGDIDAVVVDTADLIAAHRLDLDTVRDVLAQDMFAGMPPRAVTSEATAR